MTRRKRKESRGEELSGGRQEEKCRSFITVTTFTVVTCMSSRRLASDQFGLSTLVHGIQLASRHLELRPNLESQLTPKEIRLMWSEAEKFC